MNDIMIHAPQITLTQNADVLRVRVQSAELLDLPRVRAMLSEEQSALCAGYTKKPSDYRPRFVTAAEQAENGFLFDESWFFPVVPHGVEVVFRDDVREGWAITAQCLTWELVKEELPADVRDSAELVEWQRIDDVFEGWVFTVAS